MPVAKLFPYRDADNRLMFRGKIGVESKVSKFFPVRVDGRLILRGKGPDGKILWGFPYRDENGRLMAQMRYTATSCYDLADTYTVTIAGLTEVCSNNSMTALNGTWTVTRVAASDIRCEWIYNLSASTDVRMTYAISSRAWNITASVRPCCNETNEPRSLYYYRWRCIVSSPFQSPIGLAFAYDECFSDAFGGCPGCTDQPSATATVSA